MKKRTMIITLVLLAILSCMPAFSATYYDNGSQRFTITAGVNFPISTTLFEDERTLIGYGFDFDKTKFTLLGGYGSLTYQMFVNPYFALGGEIGSDTDSITILMMPCLPMFRCSSRYHSFRFREQ